MNQSLFNWLFQFSGRNAIGDAMAVFAAAYLPYFLVLGAIIIFAGEKHGKRRFFFFSQAILAIILSRGILTEIIRFFYAHPRPFEVLGFNALIPESGNSFPSGHAAFFFALATVVFLFNRRWGGVYFVLAALNGLARIFAGVHWPLDVLGGAVLGVLSALNINGLLVLSRALPAETDKTDLSSEQKN